MNMGPQSESGYSKPGMLKWYLLSGELNAVNPVSLFWGPILFFCWRTKFHNDMSIRTSHLSTVGSSKLFTCFFWFCAVMASLFSPGILKIPVNCSHCFLGSFTQANYVRVQVSDAKGPCQIFVGSRYVSRHKLHAVYAWMFQDDVI